MSEENTSPAPAETAPAPAPAPTPTEVTPPATPNQPKVKTPEEQLAEKLCIASVICYFGTPIISSILSSVSDFTSSLSNSDATTLLNNAMFWPIGILLAFGPLAGIILMIIARVKAPKYSFAKVLMWIYIVLFILKLLALIAIIILFGALIAACSGNLN